MQQDRCMVPSTEKSWMLPLGPSISHWFTYRSPRTLPGSAQPWHLNYTDLSPESKVGSYALRFSYRKSQESPYSFFCRSRPQYCYPLVGAGSQYHIKNSSGLSGIHGITDIWEKITLSSGTGMWMIRPTGQSRKQS